MSSLIPVQLNNISPYVLTERLWFNTYDGTNYRLWKTHVRRHFQRQDLLRFIDDADSNPTPPETIINPYNSKPVSNLDYVIWKRIDESLKKGILSLIEDGVIAPGEVDTLSTSRELWSYLEEKFKKHQEQLQIANGSDNVAINTYSRQVQLLRDWDEYSELYSAALLGDRIAAGQKIFSTIEANKMNSRQAMALHVAVEAGKIAIDFVENLVCRMPNDLMFVKDAGGNTALSIAAAVGNIAAAKILVANNSNLLYVPNISGDFPVHVAAKYAKRDTLTYLISVTKNDHPDQNPYEGYYGLALLTSTIEARFLDIALNLVKKYPYLATLRLSANSALKSIVKLRYRYGILEGRRRRLKIIEIVKFLCKEMKPLNFIEVEDICREAILIAAKLGNHEVVAEILDAFPSAIQCSDPSFLQCIIHVAVQNRYAEVFNIVYGRSDHAHLDLCQPDSNGNNLLHLVAKLAPQRALNKHPNAAFSMQLEMQWYKEVRRLIQPRYTAQLNISGKSPWNIFEEEHKSLRAQGEKWIKATVNTYTITAILITTVSFAATITVPGGTNGSTGFPLFLNDPVFKVFSNSNYFSQLFSTLSLLFFLRLSTTRYSENDFSFSIPLSFHLGLLLLNFSITLMMFTFMCAFSTYNFGKEDAKFWVLLLFVAFTLFAASFLSVAMPLLANIIKLWRWPGYLGVLSPRGKGRVPNKRVATRQSV